MAGLITVFGCGGGLRRPVDPATSDDIPAGPSGLILLSPEGTLGDGPQRNDPHWERENGTFAIRTGMILGSVNGYAGSVDLGGPEVINGKSITAIGYKVDGHFYDVYIDGDKVVRVYRARPRR